MADTILEEKTLKLTVGPDNIVWVIHGDGAPVNTKANSKDFLRAWMTDPSERVRIVGTAQNAELILDLYEAKLMGAFGSLQICSPLCGDDSDEREDPAATLHNMRKFNRVASLGGWHEFSEKDLATYILAARFLLHDDFDDATMLALHAHPLYPAIKFVEGLDELAVARFIGTVIDPRWYIDPNDPDRLARYDQFLCLHQKSVAQANHQNATWRNNRYVMVQNCWKPSYSRRFKEKTVGPRMFVLRAYQSKSGGMHGDLAASKCLANYLRAVWTQVVYNGPLSHRLFVPKHFFQKSDEAIAYEFYMSQWRLKEKGVENA